MNMSVRQPKLWQMVLGGAVYVVVGTVAFFHVNAARVRMVEEAYFAEEKLGHRTDYPFGIWLPPWPGWIFVLPPYLLLVGWLLVRMWRWARDDE
jgi:hypothetical protein